ncbi:hypothetical protein ABIF68_009962 [Bradyrhizobium japonicum]
MGQFQTHSPQRYLIGMLTCTSKGRRAARRGKRPSCHPDAPVGRRNRGRIWPQWRRAPACPNGWSPRHAALSQFETKTDRECRVQRASLHLPGSGRVERPGAAPSRGWSSSSSEKDADKKRNWQAAAVDGGASNTQHSSGKYAQPWDHDTCAAVMCRRAVQQLHSQAGFVRNFRGSGASGWGGRDRTSEWRNQNPLDSSTTSMRVWKKGQKRPPAIPIAWRTFPNKEAAFAGRISPSKPEAADSPFVGMTVSRRAVAAECYNYRHPKRKEWLKRRLAF